MRPCIIYHRKAIRANASKRSFTLCEICPVYLTCPLTAMQICKVIDWADVENSPRWKMTGAATYCNVYASDLCDLLGVYLPRVWWYDPEGLGEEEEEVPVYGVNCGEMSANRLVDWMIEYGEAFGWQVDLKPQPLREGEVGLVIGKAKSGHGHVQVLFRGFATQAGVNNYNYTEAYSESFWAKYEKVIWAKQ